MESFTDDFGDYAADLAERFARPARAVREGGYAEFRHRGDDEGLPLQDVHVISDALREQCQFLRAAKMEFPCVVPREEGQQTPIPVSLGFESEVLKDLVRSVSAGPLSIALPMVAAFQGDGMRNFSMRDIWHESAMYVALEIDEAITHFQKRLTRFLGTRLTAFRTQSTPATASQFTVETDTDKLRVSYAPIFWKSNQRAMNQLSRLANDYIASGQYYFGAGMPGNNPQFDYSASYVLPNDSYAKLAM